MSILAQFLPLIVYTVWMVRRVSKTTSAAKPARRTIGATVRRTTGRTTAIGLEDDPDQWQVWTALDERQLIRLLSDSAPRRRTAPNGADDTSPPVERGGTP